FLDLGRLQRIGNHDLQRIVPADDVDALTAELIHDVFDAAAPDPDAGTDTIDLQINARNGDLGSVAGLASQGLDLDSTVGYFGNFIFEEPADEVGVGARENDFDPVPDLADLQDHRFDALTHVMSFARNL